MKFIFVRHGQSEGNARGIRQGSRLDYPLTKLGRQQAEEAGRMLVEQKFDVILSSPLHRAKQTAEVISKKFNIPIEIIPELHEINIGDFSGKTWDEAAAFFNSAVETFKQKERNFEFDYTKWGGETGEELLNRIRKFVDYAKNKYPDQTIVVVTHAGVLRAMHHLYKRSEERPVVHNASIHEFDL